MQDLCLFRHFVKCRGAGVLFQVMNIRIIKTDWWKIFYCFTDYDYEISLAQQKTLFFLIYMYLFHDLTEQSIGSFPKIFIVVIFSLFCSLYVHNSCLLVYTWSSLFSPCCGQAWPFYSARGSSPAPPTYSHHLLQFLSCYSQKESLCIR